MPGHAALALPPPPLQRPLLVGYSGGLDSTALLHLLAREPAHRGLRAIHVHHGLQPEADAWADHCARTCAALGIGLEIVRVQVARDTGEGLEAAARRARMAAFAQALENDGVLALAHHRDDQAETFLLRALRASGSDGLGAMRPWRRFGPGWLWRPLLDLPRQALVDYARAHGLDWIEDPSNASDDHDRNYLRRRVLSLLRERGLRRVLVEVGIGACDPRKEILKRLAGQQVAVLQRFLAKIREQRIARIILNDFETPLFDAVAVALGLQLIFVILLCSIGFRLCLFACFRLLHRCFCRSIQNFSSNITFDHIRTTIPGIIPSISKIHRKSP